MTQRNKQIKKGLEVMEAKGWKLLYSNMPSTKTLWTLEHINGDSLVLDAKELIAIGSVE